MLGGRELSYDPTIDLLYVYEAHDANAIGESGVSDFFVGVGRDLTAALGDETREGLLYRVGVPRWPRTDDGWLQACSLAEYGEHYAGSDSESERIALARARPIAGDADLGSRFLAASQPFVYGERRQMGESGAALASSDRDNPGTVTIEFLTQAFQVRHGARHASLRYAGTLGTLDAMGKAGLISENLCRELDHAYVFLRSAEHRRQLGLPENLQHQVDASRERVRLLVRSVRL
jgi:glutamate-ammonia-ligase adenylyltransferase